MQIFYKIKVIFYHLCSEILKLCIFTLSTKVKNTILMESMKYQNMNDTKR